MPTYSLQPHYGDKRRAAVFINWGIPLGFGHVGWGFEKNPGVWYYGAVEIAGGWGVVNKGDNNKIFNKLGSEDQMLREMKEGSHGQGSGFYYNEYKFISVNKPNLKATLKFIDHAKSQGYGLFGNNCMDAVFRVIKKYANDDDNILPWPATHWAPRWWYCDIKSKSVFLRKDKGLWGIWGT